MWEPDENNTLNLGWGHVYQSHRSNELDVQDGETAFMEAERAEHMVLGYERKFGQGWSLRTELYQREIDDPRIRYENLFDPLGQPFGVGDKKVIPHQLNFITQFLSDNFPTVPIVLCHTIFNRDNRILFYPFRIIICPV